MKTLLISGAYDTSRKTPTSSIEWTGKNRWNFVTGCTKVKGCADCMNCYAESLAIKLQAIGNPRYKNGFELTCHADLMDKPYEWLWPSLCFTNSMSDILHKKVPDDVIRKFFKVMNDCPQHHFQVLTKRIERLVAMSDQLTFTPNIWIGTSVGTNGRLNQIELLKEVPAEIRFISYEPLITKLNLHDLEGIHWAILGGESPGMYGYRPAKIDYFTSLIENCDAYGVKVFVKQLGGVLGLELGMKNNWGRPDLKGGEFDKFPKELQRREFPIDVSNLR